jgi:hypothetical protein
MIHLENELSLTLAEAISRMRSAEDPMGKVTNAMSENTAAAFDMHDAVHILFDCGTSLEGEIAAHVWMKFGTTAKIADMHRAVAQREHKNVLKDIGHFKLLRTWLGMLPRLFGILGRARRMKKKVAFERLEELKRQTLAAIIDEHGIAR